ncbi:type II toxin-antitoxin system VapC family toxin [Methylomonas sp. UP202]|uniref:type II toxin-antitoxin system VapC family toxin n=1 Tax=unclassified Methylomonas TaxID=2608980 RepID=UPI002478E3F1|nr:type II toxin-antitoxin system VapC family toxin [Methylomonas sp. UP202]WGS84618.1 type II toxin-antitoxin system VapC family toxin [Methylomonas sp. UP202]
MSYLIDTQILIWTLVAPNKLAQQVKNALENEAIFISQISFFEIAIKQKLGKLPELDLTIDQLTNFIERDGFNLLGVQNRHIDAYAEIPLLANHRDPFDRLLLATAFSENMPIISADENFALYPPQIQLIANR